MNGAAVTPAPARTPATVGASTGSATGGRAATAGGSATDGGAATASTAPPLEASAPGRGRLIGGVLLFIAGFTVVFVAVAVLIGTWDIVRQRRR